MPKKFSETGRENSFFEKIPNLKAAFGFIEKEQPPPVNTFFQRIMRMFSSSDSASPSLRGRVDEMLPRIDNIHITLINIKQKAHTGYKDLDDELKAFIDLILEPLIEQGEVLKEKREAKDTLYQVKVLDLYQIWIERAEFWVSSYQSQSKDAFCRLVNEFIWKDFSSKVERDLKIIEDYIEHAVQGLLLTNGDKKQIKKSIGEAVAKHVQAIAALKRLPKEITFKELDDWNRSIDAERQHHFEASLAIIDREIESAKPHSHLDEHQHLLDVISMINSIEEQTSLLKHRFGLVDPPSVEFESIQQKARFLAHEAHRLSLDLRLPQSIVERLEQTQATLDELISMDL